MRIGSRDVGPGHPAFIVAEAGSNHGGQLSVALELVDAAAAAGADAVKFQLWNSGLMYPAGSSEWEEAKRWQMPIAWLPHLTTRAYAHSIAFLCSAFDFDSLDAVDPFVEAHKIASLEADWDPFVDRVIAKGKPILMSLGALDRRAAVLLYAQTHAVATTQVVPLHCVVSYPCELDDVHLRSRLVGADKLWGLSDHTTHPTIAPCAAVAMGASVIEKHFRGSIGLRYLPSPRGGLKSPDWDHSIDSEEFLEMVTAIRLTELALGSHERRIQDSELANAQYRRGPRGLRGA